MTVPGAGALRYFLRRTGPSPGATTNTLSQASCVLTSGDATVTHSANSNILINLVPRTIQTFTQSCITTNDSKLVTHSVVNSKIVAGLLITPAGGVGGSTIIDTILSPNSFLMSNDAGSSTTTTLTFTGDGIPVGTVIETINSPTSFELSRPATISETITLEFDEMFSLKDAELNIGSGSDYFDRGVNQATSHEQLGSNALYARLNPFNLTADMPDGSANHSLSEYDGYSHATIPKGVDLEGTEEPGGFSLEWVNATAPQGFTTANGCNNVIYWKEYPSEPTEVPTDVITDDPATANEPGTSTTQSVASSTNWVLVAVKTSWNDTLYSIGGAIRSATEKHDLKSGQASHGDGQILLEVHPETPTFGSITQDPAEQECYAFAVVEMWVSVTGHGSSAMTLYKSTNSGATWPPSGTGNSNWTTTSGMSNISSGGVASNVYAGDTVTSTSAAQWYFRVFYNSVGNSQYTQASHYFDCNQGL